MIPNVNNMQDLQDIMSIINPIKNKLKDFPTDPKSANAATEQIAQSLENLSQQKNSS